MDRVDFGASAAVESRIYDKIETNISRCKLGLLRAVDERCRLIQSAGVVFTLDGTVVNYEYASKNTVAAYAGTQRMGCLDGYQNAEQ